MFQPSLFAWRKNDSPVKVETLSSHLSDSGSDASDEDEEDEEEGPCDMVDTAEAVPAGSVCGKQSKTVDSLCADKMPAMREDMDVSISEDCIQAEDRRSLQRLLETDEDVIPEI